MVGSSRRQALLWGPLACAAILLAVSTASAGPWTPATGTSTDSLYVGKDYADTLATQPLVFASGDWVVSAGPPVPWSNIDISGCTTGCGTPALPDSYNGGTWSGDHPIGFTFNFFGCTFTNVRLHGIGAVGFAGGSCAVTLPNPSNTMTVNRLDSTSKTWYVIFPFASNDQNAGCVGGSIAPGNVKTKQIAATATSPAVFVIQFTNAPFMNGGSCGMTVYGRSTYQVRLYEGTNVVEVHYNSVSNSDPYGGAATDSGIKGGTTAKYLRYSNLRVASSGTLKTAAGLVVQYRPMNAAVMPVPTPVAVNDTYTFNYLDDGPNFRIDGKPHGVTPYTADALLKNDRAVASASFVTLYDGGLNGGNLTARTATGCAASGPGIAPNGTFCFTPPTLNPCRDGPYSFRYKNKDAWNTGAAGTVTLKFTNCNLPPNATDDGYSATEDTPVAIAAASPSASCPAAAGILCNDEDDGKPLSPGVVRAVLSVAPGTGAVTGAGLPSAAPGGNGAFTYTPGADVCGTDTFRYRAFDGIAYSENATVTFTIACTPDSPIAVADSYTVDEDGTLDVDSTCAGTLVSPKCNDRDPDDQTGTLHRDAAGFSVVASPLKGTLSFPVCASCPGGPGGSFRYVPATDFCGTDAFQYRLTDDAGMPASAPATVTITVTCLPDPDAYSTVQDEELNVPPAGILANDNDAAGTIAMTAVLTSPPASAAGFALSADGSFDYLPTAGFTGTDSFRYQRRLADGTMSGDVLVTITVGPVNPALIARGDTRRLSGADHSFGVVEDQKVTVSAPTHATKPGLVGVLANDHIADTTTPWSLVVVAAPVHGTITLRSDGSFDYDATEPDYNGLDTFRYKIVQGGQESNPAIAVLRVASVNDAPVGSGRTFACIDEDTSLLVDAASGLLVGATDRMGLPDEGNFPLVPVLSVPASLGLVTLNTDGSFSYVPAPDRNGADSFQFRLRDAKGTPLSVPYTVTLCVTPKTDVPVAVDDTCRAFLGYRKVTRAPGIMGNDVDPDIPNGDSISVVPSSLSFVGPGTFIVNADGSWRYDPDPSMTTAYTAGFTYRIRDSLNQLSNVATVSCTVQQNLPPDAAFATSSQSALVGEGVGFTDASSDPDGEVVSWMWDFGDGYTSSLQSPNHAYPGPGVYLVRLRVADDLGATDETSHYVEIRYPPEPAPTEGAAGGEAPPEADAGPDLTVQEGTEVRLRGRVVAGEAPHRQWKQLGGPAVDLGDRTQLEVAFTAPTLTSDEPVLLTFSLTVGNNRRDSLPDLVEVLVTSANKAPEADAGRAVTALPGERIALDGLGSRDPDGDALAYKWRQASGPAAALTGADAARASFTMPDAAPGTVLVFELEVRDGRTASVDAVQVLVGRPPAAPAGFRLERGDAGEVRFEALVAGEVAWFFGDGASSTEPAPAHVYTRSGDYVVTLRVATAEGVLEFTELVQVEAPSLQVRPRPAIATPQGGADTGLMVGLGAAALVAAGLATLLVVGLRKNRAR